MHDFLRINSANPKGMRDYVIAMVVFFLKYGVECRWNGEKAIGETG